MEFARIKKHENACQVVRDCVIIAKYTKKKKISRNKKRKEKTKESDKKRNPPIPKGESREKGYFVEKEDNAI